MTSPTTANLEFVVQLDLFITSTQYMFITQIKGEVFS